jgi:hypothetical protein
MISFINYIYPIKSGIKDTTHKTRYLLSKRISNKVINNREVNYTNDYFEVINNILICYE